MPATRRELPANPNISQLKKQAKDLADLVRSHDSTAIERVVTFHPAGTEALENEPFALREAQVTLAREYGFDSWQMLNIEAGNRMFDERDLHRWLGVQLNNGMWDNIESDLVGPDLPLLDREQMLYAAYAAAYHWIQVGSVANRARGEHLISRTAVKLGFVSEALHHARRCLALVEANRNETEDWDLAFAYEAVARSMAASGDTSEALRYRALATDQTSRVSGDGDRQVLEAELTREPWFGLT